MKQTGRSGFTLLEAIIVMVLMSVIATMGAPKLSSALRQRTVASAADQFELGHSIDASTLRFWVDVDTSANHVGQRATISSIHDLAGNGLTMSSNRSIVCFDARGMATTGGVCEAGDVAITFTDADKTLTVTSTTLGKVLR